MILQALNELYDRLSRDEKYEVSPPGFSLQKVAFRVVLTPNGVLHAIEDARVKDNKGKPRPRQLRMPGHPKPGVSGLNPGFLWDTSQYMLGYEPEDNISPSVRWRLLPHFARDTSPWRRKSPALPSPLCVVFLRPETRHRLPHGPY